MSRGPAFLTVATPSVLTQALADVGRYHFGIPEGGLQLLPYSPGLLTPAFQADGSLKAGDVYVATLSAWQDYVTGLLFPEAAALAFFEQLTKTRRGSFLLSLVGYIPLRLTIPSGGTMAFSPHGKIVLHGGFGDTPGSPVEEWSCSMSYDIVGPDVGAMPNTIGAVALESVFEAWRPTIEANSSAGPFAFGTETYMDEVAYYRVSADGTTTGGQWERFYAGPDFALGDGGVGSGIQVPLSVATCVTLDAAGPRGGRFGRFYLPGMVTSYNGGRYGAPAVAGLLAAVVASLAEVNDVLSGTVGADVELVVGSGRGSGENRPVRQVKIGRVPDTMRSRRTSLLEEYSTADFQTV